MRILYAVQRYGEEVAGGAEYACRQFAERLAAMGHDVEVVTSCATSYVDWANRYPQGTSTLNGVTLHRLPVRRPREDRVFGPMNGRVVFGSKPVPLYLQAEWMRTQGPEMPQLVPWMERHAASFDVVVFFTYLYYTSWAALPTVAALVPTVLHPAAHDEAPLYLPLFDFMVRLPSALGFFVEEEAALVARRFRMQRPIAITGIGIDLEMSGDGNVFREAFGLGDNPYIIYVGRVDPAKGSTELVDFFTTYKKRHPGPLKLVLLGEKVSAVAEHDEIVATGFVDEKMMHHAMKGALALVHPSYFESFSLVLAESWALERPALVQGHCDVLTGQAHRSGGALPYRGFAEFEAAVDMLLESPQLGDAMGKAGRAYVERRYPWSVVLDRYERLLQRTAATRIQ
jgi:glycosyltransferase involved in cell wall biosynthesis